MIWTAANIEKIVELGILFGTKAVPWIIKTCEDSGYIPSVDQIESMWNDIGKDPEDYFNKMYFNFLDCKKEKLTNIITYKIVGDVENRLKDAAKLSCNFWNHFITPSGSIVVRLGTFYSDGYVIARAYMPYTLGNTIYGVVEFNTKYLDQFTPRQIAGTVIHEIGHTLGIGWDKWMGMFDRITGRFHNLDMYAETGYGPGTQYSHWDEERYMAELMTGIQDDAEYVKPETIQVMKMLGHKINECPAIDVPLNQILDDVEGVQFSRAGDIVDIVMDHFEMTELYEERYKRGA